MMIKSLSAGELYDEGIAAVSRGGVIRGVSKGTCSVYVYAHNGVYKKVSVTVKDRK